MNEITRATFYFVLALLPALTELKEPPASAWAWWLWAGAGVYQGLLALKALYSAPRES